MLENFSIKKNLSCEHRDGMLHKLHVVYLSIYIIYSIDICVGHKVWICAIHGLCCTNHESVLWAGNPWIARTHLSQFLNF